ncbi:hypothetical protein SAMN05216351_101302 [Pseudobutyrivibrio sp. JW11]|uniref:hypothetical protein n=1 Tax=Pseudobutyrivibrio sp. JW11 TaxID=1855302 RepID=UPI0008EA37B4|nr:hypothetical protein [Pseudobutyrivibrio sp. JW11]SFN82985.1 hypothetical protein SAMN05216351_101302 [Pseudobutyrivibrio sp. JW11]
MSDLMHDKNLLDESIIQNNIIQDEVNEELNTGFRLDPDEELQKYNQQQEMEKKAQVLNLDKDEYQQIQKIINDESYKNGKFDDETWKKLKDYHHHRLNVEVPVYQERYEKSTDFFKSKVKTQNIKYESLEKHQKKDKKGAKYSVTKKEKAFMKWMGDQEIAEELERIEHAKGSQLLEQNGLFTEVCVDDSEEMIAVKAALNDYQKNRSNVKPAPFLKKLSNKFSKGARHDSPVEVEEVSANSEAANYYDRSVSKQGNYNDFDNVAVNLNRLIEACDNYIGHRSFRFTKKGKIRAKAISALRDAAKEEKKKYSASNSFSVSKAAVAACTLGMVQNVLNTAVMSIQLVPWLIGKAINKMRGSNKSPFTLIRPYTPKEWMAHYEAMFDAPTYVNGPTSLGELMKSDNRLKYASTRAYGKINYTAMIFGPYRNTSSYVFNYTPAEEDNAGLVPN